MADFIGPVLGWLAGVVSGDALATELEGLGLDMFAEVKKSWTGVVMNWPPCSVMALHSDFDPEGTAVHTTNGFTVKFGVSGDDPDQVAADALGYMAALDHAIGGAVAATWLPQMSRVFVTRHDYGPLFQRDGSFAKFPEMHLEVETYEV